MQASSRDITVTGQTETVREASSAQLAQRQAWGKVKAAAMGSELTDFEMGLRLDLERLEQSVPPGGEREAQRVALLEAAVQIRADFSAGLI